VACLLRFLKSLLQNTLLIFLLHGAACPCRHFTGLVYAPKGLRSPPNITRRRYGNVRTKAILLKTLGAGANATQLAQAACDKPDVSDPECADVLLLALTPAAYLSNNTADTPGRRSYISPAQDQLTCSACVGFAVTAAAEAAVNVYRQQSWDRLGLSEQDLNFCRCAHSCASLLIELAAC
jgi:hypothetical protein